MTKVKDKKGELGMVPLGLPPANQPAEAKKSIVKALKNLMAGEASPHQQKIALEWIIKDASRGNNQPCWYSGEDGRRNTDFAQGRAFVGQQIIGLLNVNTITATED